MYEKKENASLICWTNPALKSNIKFRRRIEMNRNEHNFVFDLIYILDNLKVS
jgi:hypothetical protein